MAGWVRVLGVHPVVAGEPVHLIEIEVIRHQDAFDFAEVTQELADQPPSNWQVAYDGREMARGDGIVRYAFFFHYLDLNKALRTPCGEVILPTETPVPAHLQDIEYEEP